jgi:hypothetical protein
MEGTDEWRELNSVNLRYAEIQSAASRPPKRDENDRKFPLFPALPVEIRIRIWEAALTPRIIRWIRMGDRNVFSTPSKALPLLAASRESRDAAFLYGKYQFLTASPSPLYFSPVIDYLWFDPGWTMLHTHQSHLPLFSEDPLEPLLPDLSLVQNIMVHPNWSDQRMRPTVLFAKLPLVKRVLVAADEKSIGFQSDIMLETVEDIKKYYSAVLKNKPEIKRPYIAVGCLGWTGEKRRNIRHGSEDTRQLVTVFENDTEMKAHLNFLRDEEWKFTQERFHRPKIDHNLRRARERKESTRPSSSETSEGFGSSKTTESLQITSGSSYVHTVVTNTEKSAIPERARLVLGKRGKWHRLKRWCRNVFLKVR